MWSRIDGKKNPILEKVFFHIDSPIDQKFYVQKNWLKKVRKLNINLTSKKSIAIFFFLKLAKLFSLLQIIVNKLEVNNDRYSQ